MRVKEDVTLDGLKPGIRTALPLMEKVFEGNDVVMVVTSTTDDVEGRVGTAHTEGRAVDLRAHQINPYLLAFMRDQLRKALGLSYKVVVEMHWPEILRVHFHVEFIVG